MICNVRGINLDYEVLGEGRPIVILRKWMMQHFEPVFKEFSGWKRIYIDHPGSGGTETKDWIKSSDDILEVILEAIGELVDKERFSMMGFSYCGYLSMGVMMKKQEQMDGLAVFCPVVVPEFSKRRTENFRVLYRDEEFLSTLSAAEREQMDGYVKQDKQVWDIVTKSHDGTDKLDFDFFNSLKQSGQYAFSFDVRNFEKPFLKPALIILGRQDNIVGYKDMLELAEDFPRATVSIFDMTSHGLIFEQGDMLRSLIADWLDRMNSESNSNS